MPTVPNGSGVVGSGNVATDTIFDAKGDLPAGTGANTSAKRTVGANGTFLKANSAETTGMEWAVPTLDDLSDVVVTTPAQGDNLKHNGTSWVNQQLDLSDLSDVALSGPATNEFLRYNGAQFVNSEIADAHLQPGIGAAKIADGSVSDTEFQYLNGVTSNIQTQLDAVNAAIVLKGEWNASAGTFPGAGAAQAGWSYIVTVGGTVDSVVFAVGDRLIAIVDNASTSTFAANWFKADYTDLVSSVNGQVGAVTLIVSEVDSDNTLPGTNALGEIRTTQNGNLWHGNAANTWDQILKASNFAVRATTGTSETIASTDDKKLVTFTNASAIAVSLAQAGSGSPAVFTNGWSVRVVNLGPSKVTITPTTSTIGGGATLQLGPGQGADINSDGTNYKCIFFDSLKIGIACSDETTAITTGTAKATFRMPCAMKLLAVRASVTTAPTDAAILIDINEGGTTVLSTKLMIDASEKTSTTATTPYVISDAVLADDAEITIDFDQVGSTIAGAGVKVWLIGIPG